jgi:hypothetical protein
VRLLLAARRLHGRQHLPGEGTPGHFCVLRAQRAPPEQIMHVEGVGVAASCKRPRHLVEGDGEQLSAPPPGTFEQRGRRRVLVGTEEDDHAVGFRRRHAIGLLWSFEEAPELTGQCIAGRTNESLG